MSSARTQSQLWTATPISSLGRVFTLHFILESEMGRGNVQLVRTIISQIVLVVAIINESFEIQNLTKFPWFQIFLLYYDPINLVTTCFRLIEIGWRRSSMNVWLRLNRTSVVNFWIQSFFLRIYKSIAFPYSFSWDWLIRQWWWISRVYQNFPRCWNFLEVSFKSSFFVAFQQPLNIKSKFCFPYTQLDLV